MAEEEEIFYGDDVFEEEEINEEFFKKLALLSSDSESDNFDFDLSIFKTDEIEALKLIEALHKRGFNKKKTDALIAILCLIICERKMMLDAEKIQDILNQVNENYGRRRMYTDDAIVSRDPFNELAIMLNFENVDEFKEKVGIIANPKITASELVGKIKVLLCERMTPTIPREYSAKIYDLFQKLINNNELSFNDVSNVYNLFKCGNYVNTLVDIFKAISLTDTDSIANKSIANLSKQIYDFLQDANNGIDEKDEEIEPLNVDDIMAYYHFVFTHSESADRTQFKEFRKVISRRLDTDKFAYYKEMFVIAEVSKTEEEYFAEYPQIKPEARARMKTIFDVIKQFNASNASINVYAALYGINSALCIYKHLDDIINELVKTNTSLRIEIYDSIPRLVSIIKRMPAIINQFGVDTIRKDSIPLAIEKLGVVLNGIEETNALFTQLQAIYNNQYMGAIDAYTTGIKETIKIKIKGELLNKDARVVGKKKIMNEFILQSMSRLHKYNYNYFNFEDVDQEYVKKLVAEHEQYLGTPIKDLKNYYEKFEEAVFKYVGRPSIKIENISKASMDEIIEYIVCVRIYAAELEIIISELLDQYEKYKEDKNKNKENLILLLDYLTLYAGYVYPQKIQSEGICALLSLKYFRHSMERYKYLKAKNEDEIIQFKDFQEMDTYYENKVRINTFTELCTLYEGYLQEIIKAHGDGEIEFPESASEKEHVESFENVHNKDAYYIVFGSKSYASCFGRDKLDLNIVVYMFISQYFDIYKNFVLTYDQYNDLGMEDVREMFNTMKLMCSGVKLTEECVNSLVPEKPKNYKYTDIISLESQLVLMKYLPAAFLAHNIRDKCVNISRAEIMKTFMYFIFDYGMDDKDLLTLLARFCQGCIKSATAEEAINKILTTALTDGNLPNTMTPGKCQELAKGLAKALYVDKILIKPITEYNEFINIVSSIELYDEIHEFVRETVYTYYDLDYHPKYRLRTMTNSIFSLFLKHKKLTNIVEQFLIHNNKYEFPTLNEVFVTNDKKYIDHAICVIFKIANLKIDELNTARAGNKLIGVYCDPNFSHLNNVDSLQPLFMYFNDFRPIMTLKQDTAHKDTAYVINKMRHMLGGTNEMLTKIITWLLFIIALVVIVCVLVIFFVNIKNKQHHENSFNNISHCPHHVLT